MRHIARSYRDHGYVAFVIRLPGHGTVPGGLTEVEWQDWMAATRLAVREARGIVGPSLPLHLVGYSNGGALALKYALDALDDPALPRPDRLVLLSPMIGVTAFARFAGLAALPALLPAFAKAAWLSILPEFNPFKYNSFPVNAARQSYLLTVALQEQIRREADHGTLDRLAPVLTFQSILDATVSTQAVISALYGHLPANGSELVLIDINRASQLGDLLTPAADTPPSRLLPPPPRRYRATILANTSPRQAAMVARVTEPGGTDETTHDLGMIYPPDVYSLSHIALPFPTEDSLYGAQPDPAEDFGIHLGRITARGERGALVIGLDSLLRMSFNPFYLYMMERIEQDMR
jgi:alpha-beta hydrolase superfamily lysophospholipase